MKPLIIIHINLNDYLDAAIFLCQLIRINHQIRLGINMLQHDFLAIENRVIDLILEGNFIFLFFASEFLLENNPVFLGLTFAVFIV